MVQSKKIHRQVILRSKKSHYNKDITLKFQISKIISHKRVIFCTLEYPAVVERIVFLRPATSEIQVHCYRCYRCHRSHQHPRVVKKSCFHFCIGPEKIKIFYTHSQMTCCQQFSFFSKFPFIFLPYFFIFFYSNGTNLIDLLYCNYQDNILELKI